jgi:hypothetical protein
VEFEDSIAVGCGAYNGMPGIVAAVISGDDIVV